MPGGGSAVAGGETVRPARCCRAEPHLASVPLQVRVAGSDPAHPGSPHPSRVELSHHLRREVLPSSLGRADEVAQAASRPGRVSQRGSTPRARLCQESRTPQLASTIRDGASTWGAYSSQRSPRASSPEFRSATFVAPAVGHSVDRSVRRPTANIPHSRFSPRWNDLNCCSQTLSASANSPAKLIRRRTSSRVERA